MAWNDSIEPGTPAYRIAADAGRRIRVLAGPGTGKSFAIKRHVTRLLEQGVPPESILAVTFTRMSAADLVRRHSVSRSRGGHRSGCSHPPFRMLSNPCAQ
jgi:DNA helicase II / ATP-dependent DNA helicase PcrA